jgi:WD40 repeat protein
MKNLILFFLFCASCLIAFPAQAEEEPILMIDPHGHAAQVTGLMFTPDGNTLISVSHDKTIRLWDVETGDLIKTIREQIRNGAEGMLFAGALSPDGKILAVGGFLGNNEEPEQVGQIRLFDLARGEQIGVLKGHENVIRGLDFAADGKWLASASGDGLAVVWDLAPLLAQPGAEAKVVAILGGMQNQGPQNYDVAFSPQNKRKIVSAASWRTLILSELRKNPVSVQGFGVLQGSYQMEAHADQVYCVAYAPNGEYIVSAGKDGQIMLWDGTGKFVKQIAQHQNPVGTVSFSADSSKIVAAGVTGQETSVYAIPSGEKFLTFTQHTNTVEASAFYQNDLIATAGGNENDIYIWEATSGKVKTHIVGQGRQLVAIGAGKGLQVAFGNRDLSPRELDMQVPQDFPDYTPLEQSFDFEELSLESQTPIATEFSRVQTTYQGKTVTRTSPYTLQMTDGAKRETIENYPQFDGVIRTYTFTPEGNIVVGSSYSLKLYDPEGVKIQEFVGHTGEVTAVSVSADGRILASASTDQTMKLWNLANGTCLATLFVAADREWICWTPQGYYAASAGGEQYIGWQVNQGMNKAASYYPVSVFRKRFYQPELVKRTIQSGSFEQALAQINAESRQKVETTTITAVLPPTIEWLAPKEALTETTDGTIQVRAKIQADREVTDVKVLVNGRVQAVKRGLAFDEPQAKAENEIVQEITLTAGQNEIAIFAAHKDAGVTSDKRVVLYNLAELKPNLYMVAIGVSRYQRPELQLEYADDDAKAISQLFRAQEGKLYKTVNIKELYNEDATRDNILDALEWLEKETTQKDVAVIFVASHGQNDERGNFYIIPTGCDPDKLRRTGVDWSNFRDVLANLPSRVLLFLDTCHSGQLGKNLFTLRGQLDNTEAIRELASDENGVVILAASTGKEFSMEHPDWAHGAFTKALLDAMGVGNADLNQDGIISLQELDYYVSERVKELTKGAQHPTTLKPSTISRFPIVQVK